MNQRIIGLLILVLASALGLPVQAQPVAERCLTGDLNGDPVPKTDHWCYNGGGQWLIGVSDGWPLNQIWGGPAPGIPVSNQCVAGDLNGDGKADMWCYTGANGHWHVAVSHGAGWHLPIWVGPGPAIPVNGQCMTGDLNRDGKTDMWCYTGANGYWHVALSNGAGWDSQYWVGPGPSTPVFNQCLTGDLNGDGKIDMWCHTDANGQWHVALSNGAGWDSQVWVGPGPGIPVVNECLTGDLNGDGKTDMWCYTGANGHWHVALSNGAGWDSPVWVGPGPAIPVGGQCLRGDLNSDGKTDMWCYTGADGNWHVALSNGAGWDSQYWVGPGPGIPVDAQCLTGDLNGDRKADMWCFRGFSSDPQWHVARSTGTAWNSYLTNKPQYP